MARDIDLTKYNVDEIESSAEKSGLLPKGNYLAWLNEANEEDECDHLIFEIAEGPYEGRKVHHRIYYHSAKGGESQEFLDECYIQFGVKLGLHTKGDDGKPVKVPGKDSFADVVLDNEVVIEVGVHTYEGKESNRLGPKGIHTPDSPCSRKKGKTWREMVGYEPAKKGEKGDKGEGTAKSSETKKDEAPKESPAPSRKPAKENFDDV
jgi:hypothetical protein